MHASHQPGHMTDAETLRSALHALPGAPSPPDAWPQLVARLHRRRRIRRATWIGLPAALAAAAALAVTLAYRPVARSAPGPSPVAQTTEPMAMSGHVSATQIAVLRLRSRRTQAWVTALAREGAPLNGPNLAAAVAVQDRIALIDLQLSAAPAPTATAVLWARRIALLQQLGTLHLQPYVASARHRVGDSTIHL